MREDPVLHAGEEDRGELQALRGVERHQGDDAVLVVGDLVGVGDQGDPLQEVGQPGLDRARVDVGRVGARGRDGVVGELTGDGDELGEVLHAGLVLGVVGLLQRGEVARSVEHGLQDDVGPLAGVDHLEQLLDHGDEGLDVGQAAGGHAGRVLGLLQRFPEGQAVALGQRVDAGHGAVADAPLGGVEDPSERDLVVGVGQGAEVGQGVAHLLALVEAHPTDDLVGLAGADEHLLEDTRLGVGAVEDGDIGGLEPTVDELVDLVGDEAGLVTLVVGDVADDAVAVAGVAPQGLLLAALVVLDDRVGSGEDRLGGAVVLLQQDRGRVGEVLLEVEDVADVGAAEGVDRLVGVTDHHQLGRLGPRGLVGVGVGQRGVVHPVGTELVDQGVLGVVGVLVFVDQHVPEPAPVDLPHLGVGPEELDGRHDQVVEVEGVRLPQALLILLVGRDVGLLEVVAGILLGRLDVAQLVLLVADPVEHLAGLVVARVQVEVAEDQLHQPLLVLGVVDREVGLQADFVDLLAEDPHAGAVERGDPHDPGTLADQGLDALLHLGGGLVGEGDRQNAAGVGPALGDQPRDPPGQHPGLARPRARDDQEGRPLVLHGRLLRLVEPVEELLGARATPFRTRLVGRLRRGEGLEARDGGNRGLVRRTHAASSLGAGTDKSWVGGRVTTVRKRRARRTRRPPRTR